MDRKNNSKLVDQLFRRQYGRLVSILTRIFGLSQLDLVEDAIQDTFLKAVHLWAKKIPENPEAWLTAVAKNKAIDIIRKNKAEANRIYKISNGPSAISMNELFLDHEIEDAQLRMIFAACHPSLKTHEQISFALKTIAGFGTREIAAALLVKEETVKKRLLRARKAISASDVKFDIPSGKELPSRLEYVLAIIYLTFNEGFHSTNSNTLVRKELCGEAIRLCQLLLKKNQLRDSKVYALLALMCFHSSRLESKIIHNEIIDLKNQNRSLWYQPLINMGYSALAKASETSNYSSYHYEAMIASVHIHAPSFQETDWAKILELYDMLYTVYPSEFILLNQAIIYLQIEKEVEAKKILDSIKSDKLEQRTYLYYGTFAEYYLYKGESKMAKEYLKKAIANTSNSKEQKYLSDKLSAII